jgi:AcrR family transcriptional regulator
MVNDDSPTRQRILMSAVEIIDEHGEAALRLMDVARRAGITLSLITHYFGTRDNLVAEAHTVRFKGLTSADAKKLVRVVGSASTKDEFRAALSALTAEVLDRKRASVRLARISAIGAAYGRPELLTELGDTMSELNDTLTEVITTMQDEGFLRPDIDPRAVATFISAYSLGAVVADLDARPADREQIAQVIGHFADAIIAA